MSDLTWDAWKIAPQTTPVDGMSLNVQGISLHDILCLVRVEIDKLRRGDPKAAIAALSNRFDDDKAKTKTDIARLNEKIDRLNKKVMEGVSNDGLEDKLKKALDRIRDLEEIVHTKIPPPVQPVVEDLENRVKLLEDKLAELANVEPAGPTMPDDMVERLDAVEQKAESAYDKCSNLVDRVRQLEDSTFALSSQQGKIIGDIAKLATSNEATQRNLDNVENMTDRHTEDIKDLFANKADISDLNDKFRASGPPPASASTGGRRPSSAHSRGGVDDGKLADMVHELDKQLKLLSVATTEGLNGVQKKTDKKIEFMTNWIIKYLKGLLNNGGMDGDKETDIGKVQMGVKCLVCNKPAKQNENDGAFPHPNFRTTFGVKKERKVRTDSNGNRLDSGTRGSYNTMDDWRVQRSDSPPRNSDSPPTVDRPKSAGPNKHPHVKAIQLADSFEHVAKSPGYDDVDMMQRSATYNGDEAEHGTPFYREMEK